jgi:hypothetical protein
MGTEGLWSVRFRRDPSLLQITMVIRMGIHASAIASVFSSANISLTPIWSKLMPPMTFLSPAFRGFGA